MYHGAVGVVMRLCYGCVTNKTMLFLIKFNFAVNIETSQMKLPVIWALFIEHIVMYDLLCFRLQRLGGAEKQY